MNAAPATSAWPRQRFLGAVAAVFLLQLGLVFLLGDRPATGRAVTRAFAVSLPQAGAVKGPPGQINEDPALFALANYRGFSGSAWLKPPRVEHRYYEWSLPPHYLGLDRAGLGQDFVRYVQQQSAAQRMDMEKTMPVMDFPVMEGASLPLPVASRLVFTGPLAQRHHLEVPPLPDWRESRVLKPSVLLLGVDRAGFVRNATLIGESGLKEADAAALTATRRIRFEPLPEPASSSSPARALELMFGQAMFYWQTTGSNHTAAPAP
jgi:hypothetical protein